MLRGALPFRSPLEADGDAQELQVAIAIPDQQLLPRRDLFAALVVDLALGLQGREVLLLWEAGAVNQGHPVAGGAFAVDEVAQAAVLKDLREGHTTPCQRLPAQQTSPCGLRVKGSASTFPPTHPHKDNASQTRPLSI